MRGWTRPGTALCLAVDRSGSMGGKPLAASAVAAWKAGRTPEPAARLAFALPTPRIAEAIWLASRNAVDAMIDISDGLLADLGHVCVASGVGAQVELDMLPASDVLRDAFDARSRRVLQATGGDDYELCFTAAPNQRAAVAEASRKTDVPVTRIGRIVEGHGATLVTGHDPEEWPKFKKAPDFYA